ncbi:DNA repair protein RAD50-like [Littorina saxatilis]|uniref:Zinc-hook domain-containing protein n=1 Tax=Littorina saxatilis TaxID=31220 RepID=A0AAN9G7I7_9CAEN
MSWIERMSIMGIRSFGPEDSDRQIMQFFSPLTLIVGPNGTGKTTLIECLKYITTGDFPPNAKGAAFVHDPKVAHETVVRGQVRLQLRDVTGKIMQVQRSIESTQKAKKIEARTLDAVVTRINAEGEKVSIATKCIDFDREMVTALGVSKAILENVIFCHQEDSCWPLSEGKALKDKFDAIFASTRYVKVLDNIRALKKDQDGNLKIYKEEIKYLAQHKEKAAQLEGDLAELEAKYEASKENVIKIEKQLEPIRQRLTDIGQRYDEIYKIQSKIESFKSRKGQMESTVKSLLDNIENEFQGPTEELEKLLSEFADKVQDHRSNLSQFEHRGEDLAQKLNTLDREKSGLLLEVGKLEQEAAVHEDNIRRRDATIRKLSVEFGFEGFDRGAITEERYRTFLDKVRQKTETMMEEIRTVKADFEKQEQALQQRMDAARDKKTQLEQTQRYKKEQMDKNKAEIRQIKQKLSHMEASAGRLDNLKQELKNAERDLSVAESTVNVDELKRDITQLDRERKQLDAKMNELNSEMSRLHLQSNTRAQLDMLKKDKTSKEDNIRRIKAKHEDSLTHILGSATTTNIRGRLEEYISRQTESTRRCSSELQKAKNQLSQKEAEKNLLSKQIRDKEEEVRALVERIHGVCGSQNYEEGFQTVQQKLSEAQDQKGSLLGADHFFKKYVRELERDHPCCPLCHREFDAEQEVRELVLELQNKLRMVPTKLQRAEEELMEHQQGYDNMMQLRPIKESLAVIQDRDLPNLKKRLQKVTEEMATLKEFIDEKGEELAMKEVDEGMGKDMQPDIVLMDRYQGELRELDKKIAAQSGKLAGGDADRTLEVVVNEKDDIQMKLETVSRQLEHKRQKLSDHTEHVQSLRSQVNGLQTEKLEIDAELQERTKLEETQAQLTSDNIEHDADIKAAQEQLRPLEDEIGRHRREKATVTGDKEAAVEQGKNAVDDVRGKEKIVKDFNENIKAYNKSGKQGRLEKSRDRQREISVDQGKLDAEQEEVTANVNKMRKILATQQIHERELSDNLQLRKQQEEIERLERQMADLQKELGGLDPKNLERERQKLLQRDDEFNKELNKATGRQQGYEDQMKQTKRELNSDLFRDAAKKHREKMIDLRTTELANNDLEKYYKAMDRAIMNYHSTKMTEINMIIRELWRNTYRGNDIDTIEIRSDDDDGSSIKARRTYNYRVVMLKGDTALDMRGRCSAGQKVLASLIIRLALAETFCMNCGVFALDEPTTNLDQENIDSLAHALVRIIETRSVQRNFQLIVITHDETFVEKLGRSDLTEFVWKVSKNHNGNSRLNKDTIQQFQHR